MNDDQIDDLLADLRTDVPEMSDKAFEAGRARLQAKVSPEPVVTVLERDVTVVPLPKRRLLRSPPRKLVTVAAAVMAVAVAAGALVVQAAGNDDAPGENAATRLNIVAESISPVDEPIEPDQYHYSVSHVWGMYLGSTNRDTDHLTNDVQVMVETVQEQWVPADPTRDCVYRNTTTGNRKWLKGDLEKARQARIEVPRRESHTTTTPCDTDGHEFWGRPSPELLASLSRDPARLNDQLRLDDQRTHVQFDPDLTLFVDVASLLGSGMVPADLRAALYRTLALTPGVEMTGQVANMNGVKGTAFGINRVGVRQEVIIDPDTGQLIGQRQIYLAGQQVSEEPGTASPDAPTPLPSRFTRSLSEDMVVSYSATSNPVIVDEVGKTS